MRAPGSEGGGGRGAAPAGRAALCGLLFLAALPAAGAAGPVFDPSQSDPRAIVVADLVMAALGGREAWERTRYIHFAFVVRRGDEDLEARTHLWDRHAGRLRYENVDRDGRSILVLEDLGTRAGTAFRAGVRLEAGAARPLLEEAYEAWINDTYWLLMPYKMKDPGVRLKYAGETREGGAVYDTIELSFDNVGLTPKDRYWAFVNRDTHLMERWSYVLQDDAPGTAPRFWEWQGWTRVGRLLLAPEKVSTRKEAVVRILHPILEIYDSVPDAYFESPGPLPDRLGPGGS
jgi:hypothetical protein